jgi:hypothetical protein
MNPKSRMVIFAVTLLLGALGAQAAQKDRSDEPWVAITAENGKTYYLLKAKYDHFIGDSVISGDQFVEYAPRVPASEEYEAAKKKYPNDIFRAMREVSPRWKLFKLPPKSEIERSEAKKKEYGWALAHISSPAEDKDPRLMRVLFYDLDDRKDGYLQRGSWVKKVADAPKAGTPEGEKPKQPVSGGAQKPAGVDDEVWKLLGKVDDSDPGKPEYAKVLQLIKEKNAPEYKEIDKGGQAAAQKVAAVMAVIAQEQKRTDAQAIYGEITSTAGGKKSRLQTVLDEIRAAPIKTPGGVESRKGTAVGNGDGAETGADGLTGLSDSVNIITERLNKFPDQVGASIGERLADYIINGNEQGFIAKSLRDKPDVMERIKKLPGAWVAEKVKQKKAGEAAQVYFVLGAGNESLAWLADKPALQKALADKDAQRTKLFLEAMKPWTKTPPDERGVGQCAQADVAVWVHEFLGTNEKDASYAKSAVQVADAVLKNPMVQKELGEIAKHIQDRVEGPVVPGGTGGPGGGLISGSAKGFDFNSLFRRGGLMEDFVYQNGDKVSRAISIKLYTVKEGGQLVNKVGIFDVTNPADAFGQKFSILGNHEMTFALDDRVLGKPKYTLKFESKGSDTIITFGREGNPAQMSTTLSELYAKRAEQAVTEGNVTQVGGKSYYVLGQGGAKGSLLFFPSEVKDRIKSGGDLSPELAAEVNQRSPDGRNQNIPYKVGRDLGSVGGKPYHLEFNREHSYWEVKEGAGDPDTPPPAPTTGQDPGTQPGSTTTAPGNQPGAPTDATGIEDNLQKEGFKQNAAVRDGLREDLRDKIRVWSWTKPDARSFATRHAWIFPAELFAPRNLPVPVPALDQGEAEAAPAGDEIRGLVHFIATSRPNKTLYFDLDQPKVVEIKDGQPQNHPYAQAGYVNGGSFGIPDGILLPDAVARSKFPLAGKKIEDVLANFAEALKKREGSEAYSISGTAVSGALNVTFGKNRLSGQFWPTLDQNFKPGGGHETNPGPGHAFDFGGLGLDDGKPLKDTLDVPADAQTGNPAETVTKAAKADDDSAMLYVNKEGTRWFFVYKFTVVDDKGAVKQVSRSGAGWVFAKGQKEKPAFPSAAVKVKGLKALAQPANGEFRYTGDDKKGMWYGVASKTVSGQAQNAVNLSSNCLGPVIFWGMDDAAALSACKKDSL